MPKSAKKHEKINDNTTESLIKSLNKVLRETTISISLLPTHYHMDIGQQSFIFANPAPYLSLLFVTN